MSAPTAPGVYVRELPSGNRAVVGVSTSRTAFVGPALRGPVDVPVRISSWSEYETRFGGLWVRSVAGQAVRHFFLNGGSDALIVRVVNGDTMVLRATTAAAALTGFDHLTVVTAAATGGTFGLTVAAHDAAGTVLTKGSTDYRVTVPVDLAGDPATAIGAATVNDTALVEVVGPALTGPPPVGTVRTARDAEGRQSVVIGSRATAASADQALGLRLRVSPEARAVPGFDRLRATVENVDSGAGTFDLALAAVDAAGTVLKRGSDEVTATVTAATLDDESTTKIKDAKAAGTPAIPLAAVVGTLPTRVPAEGVSTGAEEVLLASTLLRLRAADPGAWGNRLRTAVSTEDAEPGSFHLTVTELDAADTVVASEAYFGVSTDATAARALGPLLELQSRLVRFDGAADATSAAAGAGPAELAGGADGAAPRLTQDVAGDALARTGIHALVEADVVNLLCLPLDSWRLADAGHRALWTEAAAFCERRRAFLLVDPPEEWADPAVAATGAESFALRSDNAALYYPRVRVSDPLREGRLGEFPPCGVVAGVLARVDGERGVWKAPAGIDASLRGVPELAAPLQDAQHGTLNGLGVNCLRAFPVFGRVVWGARTLNGADVQASDWKYVPVRRLALFLEESLQRGSRWAVFEPNSAGLWAQMRLSVGAFLQQLFRQGAFAGTSPAEAYFVKCDAETTTPGDIERGVVNVLIGFAPLRPAEFVIIRLQQLAAQAGQ